MSIRQPPTRPPHAPLNPIQIALHFRKFTASLFGSRSMSSTGRMARAVVLCLPAFLWAPNHAICAVMGQTPSAGENGPERRDQVDGGAEGQAMEEAFPASTAIAESVSPESLSKLSECVASFVADDEIVGAELLVIKNGRTLLHRGYGWRDREGGVAMDPG